MDDGWVGMLDLEIIGFSLEGPLGTSTLLRLIGLVMIIAAATIPRLQFYVGVLGAILIAISFAVTGHATRNPTWVLMPLLTLHIMAVTFWFGALVPLYHLSGRGKSLINAAAISERFGKQAMVIVPILMVVGLVFAYLTVGSLQNLLATNYGWALLIKLGVVSCVLTIAAANKLRFVPRLMTESEAEAAIFRRALICEFGLFILIFVITAILTTTFTLPE